MPLDKCTCAFRLYHMHASMSEGGAMNSCTGAPLGRGKPKANTQQDTMAAYLGISTNRGALPAELQNDEVELGFAEDADLKVQMPSQHIPHIMRATWFQGPHLPVPLRRWCSSYPAPPARRWR